MSSVDDVLSGILMEQEETAAYTFEYVFHGNTLDTAGGYDLTGSASYTADRFNIAARALLVSGSPGPLTAAADASLDGFFNSGGTLLMWLNVNSAGEQGFGEVVGYRPPVGSTALDGGWLVQTMASTGGNVLLRVGQIFTGSSGFGIWGVTVPTSSLLFIGISYDASDPNNDPVIVLDNTTPAVTEMSTPSGLPKDGSGHLLRVGDWPVANRQYDGIIDHIAGRKGLAMSADQMISFYNETKPVA